METNDLIIWGVVIVFFAWGIYSFIKARKGPEADDYGGYCSQCGGGLRTEWIACPLCGTRRKR